MKKYAFFYVIAAGILWGTSGIFVHYMTPLGFTPFQLTAVRGAVSFVFMVILALVKDRKLFRIHPKNLLLFAGIGMSLFGTAGFYFTSMQMTSVPTAVVLMYTAPVYVMIFSVLVWGEKLSGLKLLSVVLMLAGCCLVSGVIGGLKFHVAGILIGLLSGISYASYNILTKLAMKGQFQPVTANIYSFLFMTLIAMSLCEPGQILTIGARSPLVAIPLMIGLGVVTFVLPYFLYASALRVLPAGTASALSIVEPMAATVFSVVLFREKLDPASAVGIVLILLAVFLLGKAEDIRKTSGKAAKP